MNYSSSIADVRGFQQGNTNEARKMVETTESLYEEMTVIFEGCIVSLMRETASSDITRDNGKRSRRRVFGVCHQGVG